MLEHIAVVSRCESSSFEGWVACGLVGCDKRIVKVLVSGLPTCRLAVRVVAGEIVSLIHCSDVNHVTASLDQFPAWARLAEVAGSVIPAWARHY